MGGMGAMGGVGGLVELVWTWARTDHKLLIYYMEVNVSEVNVSKITFSECTASGIASGEKSDIKTHKVKHYRCTGRLSMSRP